MTREEFLQGLKEALDGNMDASAIQENLNYYNEYINEEVRKGKTEQQVVDTLGDSWAIAQTLLEADENGADGGAAAGSSYGTYMKEEEGRVFEIPWWKKALFILAVVLVIVVIISFVAGVIRIPCSDSYSTADRNVDYSTDRRKWIAAINGIIIMHYILDTRVKRSETTCACTLVVE